MSSVRTKKVNGGSLLSDSQIIMEKGIVNQRRRKTKSTQTIAEDKIIAEFAGYTTVHGVYRIVESKSFFQKLLWIFLFLGSSSFFLFEVYRLFVYFTTFPVNTKVTLEHGSLLFPGVSICNINPVMYSSVKQHPYLYDVINQTAAGMNINLEKFEAGLQFMQNNGTNNETLNQVVQEAKRRFFVRLGSYDDASLKAMSQKYEDFFIQCKYSGMTCGQSDFELIRDEQYGYCFTFTPSISTTEIAGPQFGLEVILNVNQKEYVPFVTEAAGVRVKVHDPLRRAFLNNGHTFPTGFEIDVAMTLAENIRLTGMFAKCDIKNAYGEVLACIHTCIGKYIAKHCRCASEFWFISPDIAPFLCDSSKDIECISKYTVMADCSSCKVPCREINYKTSMSFSTWPSGKYEPILKSVVETNQMNYTDIRNDLLLIRVYFSSLSKETIEEEWAYRVENFISDIGGQLGLWIGMSVLSVFEVIELVALLIEKHMKKLKRTSRNADMQHESESDMTEL